MLCEKKKLKKEILNASSKLKRDLYSYNLRNGIFGSHTCSILHLDPLYLAFRAFIAKSNPGLYYLLSKLRI